MTDELVTIASIAPMAMQLVADAPPGLEAETVVINGARHASAIGGVALTHDVPASLFHGWLAKHPHLAQVLAVLTPAQIEAHQDQHASYGWEPGVAKVTAENAAAAPLSEPGNEPETDKAAAPADVPPAAPDTPPAEPEVEAKAADDPAPAPVHTAPAPDPAPPVAPAA